MKITFSKDGVNEIKRIARKEATNMMRLSDEQIDKILIDDEVEPIK